MYVSHRYMDVSFLLPILHCFAFVISYLLSLLLKTFYI
jgi:hypothetical protein